MIKLVIIIGILVLLPLLFPSKIFPLFTQFLVINETPVRADAIITLLGGEVPERVIRSAELYHQGWAPVVLYGTGYIDAESRVGAPPDFKWPQTSIRYSIAFDSLKVPESARRIVNTEAGFDTSGELTAIAAFCRENNIHSVMLVTSATHTRRTLIIWNRIAPDIRAVTIASAMNRTEEWWHKPRTVREVGYEFGALLKEYVRRLF